MSIPEECPEDIFLPGGRLRVNALQESAVHALDESLRYAKDTRWDSVRSPHLFMGLLAVPDPGVRNWGERLGADLPRLLDQFRELFQQDECACDDSHICLHREFLSDNVIRVLREAYQRAVEHQRDGITPMDL